MQSDMRVRVVCVVRWTAFVSVSSSSVHIASVLTVGLCAVVKVSFKLSKTTFLNIHEPYTLIGDTTSRHEY